jgi:hypothetical protein
MQKKTKIGWMMQTLKKIAKTIGKAILFLVKLIIKVVIFAFKLALKMI